MRNHKEFKAHQLAAFCSCVLLFCIPAGLLAAPDINVVSGEISAGEDITITGSGFGAGGELISWDDFEGGTNGSQLGSPVYGPTWSFLHPSSNTPIPSYSNVRAYSGNLAAKVAWKEPGYSGYSINAFGWVNKGPFPQLYVSVWEYHDPNPTAPPDNMNNKLMYTYGGVGSNEVQQWLPQVTNRGGDSYYLASMVQNQPGDIFYWQDGMGYMEKVHVWGRWETYVQYDSSPNAGDGIAEMWWNGSRKLYEPSCNLNDVAGGGLVYDLRIGHMFQGFDSKIHVRSYLDNVYVSTSRARVELGNNQNFMSCTHREIQIPESWNSNQISVSMQFSGYETGQTAYLFVVDGNGVPSDGHEIIIDSGTVQGDRINPEINLQQPVGEGELYEALDPTITVSGTASDNEAVAVVAWSNDRGGYGEAVGTTNWVIEDLPLFQGTNVIEITAYDTAGNMDKTYFNASYDFPGQPGQPEILK
ncbi:MAG: hypothetical protein ABIF77_09600 [bacterium]